MPGQGKRLDADPLANNQERLTIEHEAAHATIYLLQGETLAYVDAGPDQPLTALAHPRRRHVDLAATAAIAGQLIEARYGTDIRASLAELVDALEDDPDCEDYLEHDLAIFVRFPEYFDVAHTMADLLLNTHRALHEELSDALWSAPGHRLNAADIAALPIAGPLQFGYI